MTAARHDRTPSGKSRDDVVAASPRVRRRAQWVAAGVAAAVVGALAVVDLTLGHPRGPDGGVPSSALRSDLYRVVALAVAVGGLLAVRAPASGAAVLVVAAVGLTVLAALEYDPWLALLPALPVLAAATAALLARPWRRRRGLAAAVVLGSVVVAAAAGAGALHARQFGPTHPQSTLRQPAPVAVDWAWAGGTTARGVTVTAKLRRRSGEVRLLMGRRDDLRDARRVAAAAASDLDGGVVRFDVDGLEPDTRYAYALEVDGVRDRARSGSVRTFPSGPATFTVAFGSCARTGTNGRVFEAVRAAQPLLFLSLGDLHYANIEENDPALYGRQYDRFLTRPAPAALVRSTSTAYVWDDHDYGPNDADASAPGRPAAVAAYRRHVPHYPLPDADGGIYQAFTIGRVRFVLLDGRSARTERGMLGPAQHDWLRRELTAAVRGHALVVLVSPVPWIGEPRPGDDAWAGYPDERRAVADLVQEVGVGKVLMLAGDAHMLAIDDGSHSGYATRGGHGFPVMQAAPLDKGPSVKGGPYSEGVFTGSGQFGTLTVRDDGGPGVEVELVGRDWTGRELVRHRIAPRTP